MRDHADGAGEVLGRDTRTNVRDQELHAPRADRRGNAQSTAVRRGRQGHEQQLDVHAADPVKGGLPAVQLPAAGFEVRRGKVPAERAVHLGRTGHGVGPDRRYGIWWFICRPELRITSRNPVDLAVTTWERAALSRRPRERLLTYLNLILYDGLSLYTCQYNQSENKAKLLA